MKLSVSILKHFAAIFAASALISGATIAQNAAPQDNGAQNGMPTEAQQQKILKSIDHMLRRAELTRSLAAEHLEYIKSNRDKAETRLLEDASQVMAFDLICDDEKMDYQSLNQIAADASYKIGMMAGNSTIAGRLREISKTKSVEERMELIGDVATTVLMYEIGRRRGLFDALLTDFGKKRFCAGMQTDMRTRFNEMITGLGD